MSSLFPGAGGQDRLLCYERSRKMGDGKGCCHKPEEEKEKPEGCSPEQTKECSDDVTASPCCPKKDDKE